MKSVTNKKLVKRNRKIGQYTTLGAMGVLVVGFIISLNQNNTALFPVALACLIVGFVLSQVGIYFTNRWGRSPRADEKLTAGLKGLEEKYTLYNYTSPVSHLVVGPAGVWVVLPFYQQGTITYERGRLKQKGGNWYLKIFGGESLGRPEVDARSDLAEINRFLEKEPNIPGLPEPKPVFVFYHPKTVVNAEESPIPTIHIEKAKDFFRKKSKETPAPPEAIKSLQDRLPKDDIE